MVENRSTSGAAAAIAGSGAAPGAEAGAEASDAAEGRFVDGDLGAEIRP